MRLTLQQILLGPVLATVRYRVALGLYLAVLAIGSIPGARADVAQVASGLVLHASTYAFLTFLVFTGRRGSAAQRATRAVLTIMAMGALDELIQSQLPYRHGSVSDWLLDSGSALLMASAMWLLWNRHAAPA